MTEENLKKHREHLILTKQKARFEKDFPGEKFPMAEENAQPDETQDEEEAEEASE